MGRKSVGGGDAEPLLVLAFEDNLAGVSESLQILSYVKVVLSALSLLFFSFLLYSHPSSFGVGGLAFLTAGRVLQTSCSMSDQRLADPVPAHGRVPYEYGTADRTSHHCAKISAKLIEKWESVQGD